VEQRKKQLDWLATNIDDITTQSHSLIACSREKKSPSGKRALGNVRFATAAKSSTGRDFFLGIFAIKFFITFLHYIFIYMSYLLDKGLAEPWVTVISF
jgi:hypothetical protein